MRTLPGRWAAGLLMVAAFHAGGQVAAETPVPAPAETPSEAAPASDESTFHQVQGVFLGRSGDRANTAHGALQGLYRNEYSNRIALAIEDRLIAANPLGIEVMAVEAPLRAHLKLPTTEGLIVTKAPPESEGAKAGLRQHDVILRVADQPVSEAMQLVEVLKAQAGEKPLRLAIVREGQPLAVEAVIRPAPIVALNYDDFVRLRFARASVAEDRYLIGVTLADVDATLRAQLKLPEGRGLVVTEVIAESAAAEAGIEANDILLSLDGQPLTTIEKINEQVQAIGERKVTLTYLRGGEGRSLDISPRKSSAATETAPAAAWLGLATMQDCQSCHQNPHAFQGTYDHFLRVAPHSSNILWSFHNPSASDAGDAGQQLSKLKEQLAEMQATILALEAALTDKKATDTKD